MKKGVVCPTSKSVGLIILDRYWATFVQLLNRAESENRNRQHNQHIVNFSAILYKVKLR